MSGIIGAKGIALTYVVRDEDQPILTDQHTWEEKARLSAILDGLEYLQDRKTVHQMILRNITDDSDAYTNVKSTLDQKDGRKEIIALKERYYNNATQQKRIN